MNLESLKSALAKLPKWIKANPKKAAVIGVVVIALAYLAIKAGSKSTGESLAQNDSLDSAGGGLGMLESGGSGGGFTGTGSTPEPTTTTTTTTTSDSGFGGGGIDSNDFALGESLPAFSNSTPVFSGSSAAILAAPASRGLMDVKKAAAPSPAPVAAKVSNTLVQKSAPAPVAAKVSNTLKPAAVALPKTDAEKAGLSKYFTGVSGGKRYAAGLYIGNVAIAAPAKKAAAPLAKRV